MEIEDDVNDEQQKIYKMQDYTHDARGGFPTVAEKHQEILPKGEKGGKVLITPENLKEESAVKE